MDEKLLATTPLHAAHLAAGGKMVPFAGWHMPLHFGSQIHEHHAVRQSAGKFDVSHMSIVDFGGAAAEPLLERLLANDVGRLDSPGRALYSAMLNDAGGVIDDLIVYRLLDGFRVVFNAATRAEAMAHVALENAHHGATVAEREDLAMIAVQGPEALQAFASSTGIDGSRLEPFAALETADWLIGRTGYTGEDGVEVMLPADQALSLWAKLPVAAIGLAARDTLRLEAGLNLYGQDLDGNHSPLTSNMGWTVRFERERHFVGREALERERADGVALKLTGIVLAGRGVMRSSNVVFTDAGDGVVTSGIFSPTLGYSIGLARVPRAAKGNCTVEIRGKRHSARLVKPPFVSHGKVLVSPPNQTKSQ